MRLSGVAVGLARRLLRLGAACALGLAALHAGADPVSLGARYGELREALRNNNFHRAMHIDSAEAGDALRGDVYAVLDHPFATVSAALKDPDQWCDILILPFNTKYCHAVDRDGAATLHVRIGRKFNQPVQNAYRLDFAWKPVQASSAYFESRLSSPHGPLGTRDYRISVSAIPIDGGRTFMHLSYSYGFGLTGRIAMQAYLATVGSNKVGFTALGRDGHGQPIPIGGMRGVIERNAMRYYLAIDAHLASLAAPPGQQLEKRIETWFDATERYPRQLRELDRATYLALKRGEHERQQAMIQ
ncbi:MAG TPA: hypothetical protein VLI46_00825 [Ramlibacter sp.]|nr:hypothetical protein [Ramlibacter sp.]